MSSNLEEDILLKLISFEGRECQQFQKGRRSKKEKKDSLEESILTFSINSSFLMKAKFNNLINQNKENQRSRENKVEEVNSYDFNKYSINTNKWSPSSFYE